MQLTGDNLEKRNIVGPHRCALCTNNFETAQHLFMECRFAEEVWVLILQDFQIPTPTQNYVADLFASWSQYYSHRIPSKYFWHRIWIALPKYVCWQIWLARNQRIFKELLYTPLQVAAKAKSFLLEAAQYQYFKEDHLLLPEEKRWLGRLVTHVSIFNPPKVTIQNGSYDMRMIFFKPSGGPKTYSLSFSTGRPRGTPVRLVRVVLSTLLVGLPKTGSVGDLARNPTITQRSLGS